MTLKHKRTGLLTRLQLTQEVEKRKKKTKEKKVYIFLSLDLKQFFQEVLVGLSAGNKDW